MPYVALKRLRVGGGREVQPGEHIPEADSWKNPDLWVAQGRVRWVAESELAGGRWVHLEHWKETTGKRHIPAASYKPPSTGASAPPAAPAAKADERKLLRLPLLDEYVGRGYVASGYGAFIHRRVQEGQAAGQRVEVREPTAAEVSEMGRMFAEDLIRAKAGASANPEQATRPAGGEGVEPGGDGEELTEEDLADLADREDELPATPVDGGQAPSHAPATPSELPPPSAPGKVSEGVPPVPMPGPAASVQEGVERQLTLTPASLAAELPPRKEMEKLSADQLLALARARGLDVKDDTGKGKLLKLLFKG